MVVAGVTQGRIAWAAGGGSRGRGLHHGAAATPSSRPPVKGPPGANGAEVFLVVFISLERVTIKKLNDTNK